MKFLFKTKNKQLTENEVFILVLQSGCLCFTSRTKSLTSVGLLYNGLSYTESV